MDIISIVITGTAATLAAYLIYAKMQQKLASYHSRGIAADDVMVFGNFEDDLELGSNEIELNSADFDADNFIIEDDDNEDDPNQQGNGNNVKKIMVYRHLKKYFRCQGQGYQMIFARKQL